MKKKFLIIFLISIFLLIILVIFYQQFFHKKEEINKKEKLLQLINTNMNLTSSAFQNNGIIPSKYTCDGENINPPLKIFGIPQNTQSLVLIVDDPDSPTGTWVHWTVFNIDPKIQEISENSVPEGAVEGITDFGSIGYGGPCPHSGAHRYFFKLYALDAKLDLLAGSSKKEIEKAMEGHILDKAELIGLYSRKK